MYKTTKKCCYVGYITQAVSINLAPLLFIIFQKEFNISYAHLGAITLINFLTQLTIDILSTFLLEKIGYRISAVISQLFSAVGLFLLPILTHTAFPYAGICIATVIYSIGAGLIEVVINPIITAIPETEEGGSLIFLHSFYCWGQLFVVAMTTLALKIFGNKAWYIIAPCWGIIPLINSFAFIKAPFAPNLLQERRTLSFKLLKNRAFIFILSLMIFAGGAELAMAQWASIFAQNALGVDKLTGDLLGPCMFACFMGVGRTVHRLLGNKINFRKHIYINCVLCALCYITAALAKNPYVALAGCALCGYAISIMWPGTVSFAAEKFPEGGGFMYGLIAMAGDIGCSAAPYITGLVASMSIWKSEGLKSGMLINILYPLAFAAVFYRMTKGGENR